MNRTQITRICRHHRIPAIWHRGFCDLVINGHIDTGRYGDRFFRFLERDADFIACEEMILTALSEPWADLFDHTPAEQAYARQALAIAGA